MRVDPYRRRHPKHTVVFVDGDGVYTDEHGDSIDPRNVPPNHRCFTTWDTARRLTIEGRGEALLWKGEHIRWSPFQHPGDTTWRPALSDAYVLRVPMYADTATNLAEIARWRDWLHEYGAVPGTPGAASMGLLKGTLRKPLWCSVGWDAKRIRQSFGGRIGNGPGGPGEYRGDLFHYDLQAAYANGIGTVRYGGRWFHEPRDNPEWLAHLARQGVPVLVHARVYVPKLATYGPLPSLALSPRLRAHRHHPFLREMLRMSGGMYPTGRRIQGWWTYEEVQLAADIGCNIKVIAAWKHCAPKDSPFRHWLQAVNYGREMQGLAGSLAKLTGNALWGQFALDASLYGRRTIRRYTKGRKRPVVVKLADHPKRIPAIDLAEIVAGRVRAQLLAAMLQCGNSLICAHTDGLWAIGTVRLTNEWRVKASAQRVELLNPQKLRYHPRRKSPVTVYAGVPLERGAEAFDRDWSNWNERQSDTHPENVPVVRQTLRGPQGPAVEGV
jgi:hypothetical protein